MQDVSSGSQPETESLTVQSGPSASTMETGEVTANNLDRADPEPTISPLGGEEPDSTADMDPDGNYDSSGVPRPPVLIVLSESSDIFGWQMTLEQLHRLKFYFQDNVDSRTYSSRELKEIADELDNLAIPHDLDLTKCLFCNEFIPPIG